MFERIDKEEDGEVYVREVVDFLSVLDNNLEQSQEVIINENEEKS
jgi:Ca2+-binding EF-hand superfamily protein